MTPLRTLRFGALATVAASAICMIASGLGAPGGPPSSPPSGPPSGRAPAAGQAAQQAPVTVEPAMMDFGLVDPSQELPAVFKLRNNGASQHQIVMLLPSCKCTTTAEYTGRTIAPGETLDVAVTMSAPATPGVKEAKVNVVFTGFPKPTLLQLKCDVRLPIRAVEEFVDALKGVTNGVLTIESTDGQPFTIVSSNGVAPSFVDFDPAKDSPRSQYKVNWSVEGWPCEGMRLWWIIETDRADCPILPCRIRHECTGIKADPTYKERKWLVKEPLVSAGRIKAGQPTVLRIDVENGEPKAGPGKPAVYSTTFRQISAVQAMGPEATASLVSVQPRGTDEAIVSFDFTPTAGTSGLIYTVVRLVSPSGTANVPIVAVVEP